ncbi:MAG: amidase [Bryobacteraceae bacterium]|jgi:aspartyl-tRNA(Asn)/glutamyl-tRNA(Gln) amidotransferase subunit A
MPTVDLFFSTIGELNQRLRAGDVSAKEIVHAFGARLRELGPKYNALALPLTGRAMKAAHDVDADLKRQRFRGPLQGIPWGAKDLLSVQNTPTTWGARPYANQTFDYTATAIAKAEKKGALLLAKLAMVELAGGPMGYHSAAASLTGPGLNPWDATRWSGGSSSGSAIAVAAGLVTFALGSETVGSILTPCAFCGVTGLRPTYGLVSRYGAMPLSWTLDKIGPIGRTAEDCGLVLEAIAGADDKDSGSAGKSFYYAPQYARDLKEIHAGFAAVDFEEWAEPAARPDFAKALDTLRDMGLQTTPAKLPDLPCGAMATAILAGEAASVFEPLVASGRVNELADAKQIAGFHAAMELPAKEYLKAMRLRSLLQTALRALLSDIDVLVAPARLGPAGKIADALDRPSHPDGPRPKDPGLTALTAAANLAGLPALALPCGFAGGLPIAIQIVGRAFTENTLLAIGREFQNRTDWHKRRPPVGTA